MERPGAAELLRKLMAAVGLRLVTEGVESGADVTRADTFRPGLLLAGFERGFAADRIQVLGEPELAYLDSLGPGERAAALDRLCVPSVPCVVVAGGLAAPPELITMGRERGVPVLASDAEPSRLAYDIASYLDELLAPGIAIHGTLVDVYGVGLFFTGKSGIGKSECALDLIVRGHRLVADDTVELRRRAETVLIGTCPELTRHHMEVRGLGVINIKDLFGVASTRNSKRVELLVQLERWEHGLQYERLGLDDQTYEIAGLRIPLIRMPVAPGRNVAILVEVAARNQLLRSRGHHAARKFAARVDRQLRSQGGETPLADGLTDDDADDGGLA